MNKNNELQALFDTVTKLYFKNIQFFEKSFPNILKKIQEFEAKKSENYFLEFIDNHFELTDIKKNQYYKCNPFFDAQLRCKDLKEKPAFNLLKTQELSKRVYFEDSINAFMYINEFLRIEKNSKVSFDKFIFLGTLLGVHLNDLAKVLNSKVYLICEDSIEIFRLSLFLTDYEDLNLSAKLFFCIDENSLNTEKIVKEFLKYKSKYNHQIRFELANEQSLHYINKLTKIFINHDPFNYPFSDYLVSFKRAFYYKSQSEYGILNCKNRFKIFDKPVLFLGAGPSIVLHAKWLEKVKDKFAIVCAAACLKRLELQNIVPDVILSIDGQKYQVDRQFEVDEKYCKNSIVIASSKTDIEVAKKFNALNTFYIPDNLEVFENSGYFTGITVGDIGLDLLLRLGVKVLYMLGFDASVSNDGDTHDFVYKATKVAKKSELNSLSNQEIQTSKNLVKVKGNFEDEVFTFMFYTQMIESINETTSKKSSDTDIYNLSNGAYFQNTTSLKVEDIDLNKFESINKLKLQENLKEKFIKHSSKKFLPKDKSTIKQEKKIIEKLKQIPISKLESDFKKLKDMYKNSLSLQIVQKFFDLISPYREFINSDESKQLEYNQFKEIVKNLEDIINI